MVAGGLAAGVSTLVLPSVAAAASVGGAGGAEPTYLGTTSFNQDPGAFGHPAGGVWAYSPGNWRFHIDLSQWNLPAPDTGITIIRNPDYSYSITPRPLVNTYEISPNNQQSWYQLSMIPSVYETPPDRFFGVFVSRSVIPGDVYVTSTDPYGMTWVKTNEGADGEWDWVTNAYLRVRNSSGTIIDQVGPFWLW